MDEKKEFVVVFTNEIKQNGVQEFTPIDVVEGKYNIENDWFDEETEKIEYIHIKDIPEHIMGYAYRTIVEFKSGSISKNTIEQLKHELLEYAQKFLYAKNPQNGCIVAIDKENKNQYLFEDLDNNTIDKLQTLPRKENTPKLEELLKITPYELEEEVKKTIKGQDEAIRTIVTALWTTLKFRKMKKKNMLIIGPSGVGKTAIFEKIKQILNIPVIIFSVPGLSQAGYVGRSTDEILKQVYYETCEDIDLSEKAIIILDEIDKIATRDEGGVSTGGVQNELLKIIEGCVRYIESNMPGDSGFEIDTSQMIFIGTGAFQELHEKQKEPIGFSNSKITNEKQPINTDKLIQYGLKRELVGRLPIVVELNNLGKEELKDIILNSDESELMATINALKELGVEIENTDEVIDYIVEDAIKKQIGARGLVLTINNLFQEIFYEVGNNPNKYSKVVIGNNIIQDKHDFKLIKKRNYTRKRIKEN